MAHHEITQLARGPLLLLDYAERQGMDRIELMRLASLNAEDLADPDCRIRFPLMLKLWRAVIERENDPAIGVNVGTHIKATEMGLVGYAMYYSRDLRDALICLSRYGRIISEAVRCSISEFDESTTFTFNAHPALVALRHPVEASASLLVTIVREITQSDIVPLTVELPSPKPVSRQPYRTAFGTLPRFDCPNTALTFSSAQMSLSIVASDPTLFGYLDELAESTLRSLGSPDRDFVDQVRRNLWSIMRTGKPDLWHTASRMGISARTLQRRLREQSTSFSAVLEELRHDLSRELLENRGLAVSEVAFLLGYSEPSAFQRAFRRWRGTSPRDFQTG